MPATDASLPSLPEFGVTFYGRESVSKACLELQDAYGANVLLLLFAGWTAVSGRRLVKDDLERAAASIRAWHAEVVIPLRSLRRLLKTGPRPAPGPATEALREKIKAAELQAEMIALDQLSALSDCGSLAGVMDAAEDNIRLALPSVVPARADLPTAARHLVSELRRYGEEAGHPLS
jgi:uncharacterized protein (TIGR02444 family)